MSAIQSIPKIFREYFFFVTDIPFFSANVLYIQSFYLILVRSILFEYNDRKRCLDDN